MCQEDRIILMIIMINDNAGYHIILMMVMINDNTGYHMTPGTNYVTAGTNYVTVGTIYVTVMLLIKNIHIQNQQLYLTTEIPHIMITVMTMTRPF